MQKVGQVATKMQRGRNKRCFIFLAEEVIEERLFAAVYIDLKLEGMKNY